MKTLPIHSQGAPRPSDYTKLWNQISAKHLHISFEILIQLSGKVQNTVNDSSRILVPGNIVLMRPGDWHTIDVFPDEPHLHRDIYIRPEKMHRICDFLSPTLFDEITTPAEPIYFDISASRMRILEHQLFLFNKKTFHSFDYESMHSCICFNLLSCLHGKTQHNRATFVPFRVLETARRRNGLLCPTRKFLSRNIQALRRKTRRKQVITQIHRARTGSAV